MNVLSNCNQFQWVQFHFRAYINAQNPLNFSGFCFPVRLIGLEPTQPELPDPKSGASTNFATGAWGAFSEDVLRLRIIKQDFVLRSACTIFCGCKGNIKF